MTIKAIETRYRGYRFRSRLEAKWAVFFDALGIKWEYETESFILPGGACYLPDFRLLLPKITLLVDVKHGEVSKGSSDLSKIKECAESGKPVLVLNGEPDGRRIWDLHMAGMFRGIIFIDDEEKILFADDYWFSQATIDENTGHFWLPHDDDALRNSFGDGLVKALHASRSARFEFGESGAG